MNFLLYIIIGILIIIIFFPKKGLYWNSRKSIRNQEKIIIEDILKLIFNYEYKDLVCDINEIHSNIPFNEKNVNQKLEQAINLNLIFNDRGMYKLTNEGRKYAVKIVRFHRLWERYLADETGIDSLNWHKTADKFEHFISESEANDLAGKIGNPVFDPHGDPIPTIDGAIPEFQGSTLNIFKKGDFLEVTHIEDEPDAIYKEVISFGFYPGMHLEIQDVSQKVIRVYGAGKSMKISNKIASNITAKLIEKIDFKANKLRLSNLKIGQSAIIESISPSTRGLERRRLMDLGIVPGTEIIPLMKSPGGDPIAYNILDAGIALRKKQADNIFITSKENENDE